MTVYSYAIGIRNCELARLDLDSRIQLSIAGKFLSIDFNGVLDLVEAFELIDSRINPAFARELCIVDNNIGIGPYTTVIKVDVHISCAGAEGNVAFALFYFERTVYTLLCGIRRCYVHIVNGIELCIASEVVYVGCTVD